MHFNVCFVYIRAQSNLVYIRMLTYVYTIYETINEILSCLYYLQIIKADF